MSEFTIWSEQRKEFMSKDGFNDCIGLTLDMELKNFDDNLLPSGYKLFWGIGKKDINDKNIFADSSIVEFNFKKNKYDLLMFPMKGYFVYSTEELRYAIIPLSDEDFSYYFFDHLSMTNLKIIGTIQENGDLLK